MVSLEILEKSSIRVDDTLLQHEVDYLGVFGSVARGNIHPMSDVDLLVHFKKPVSLLQFIDFEFPLAEIFTRPIDLVTPAALSPYMKDQVLQDLQVIYESA